MSKDLISRELVLKLIEDIKMNPDIPKNYGTLLDIMREIRKLPMAYDVDKVVEQLEEKSFVPGDRIGVSDVKIIMSEKAVEIVKSGGIE